MSMPDFIMYAVLKDGIVINCGFGDKEKTISPITNECYEEKNGFHFIPMTVENSPAEIGMVYNNNKFYFEGETNA